MKRLCAILCAAGALAWASDRAQSALEAARAALDAGDYPRAVEQADQAAAGFHSSRDLPNETSALDIAGSAYLHRGDYDLALERYQKALDMDRQLHDAKGEITRLNNIGSVYFYRGRYSEAWGEYQQALQRVQQTGAAAQLVFTNLATLYEQLGENQKALDYYRQALALGPSADLLINAGTLYRRLGDVAKALDSYRTARSLFAQDHRTGAEVRVLWDIGVAQAMDLHDLNAAVTSFNEALKLAPSNEAATAHLYRGEALHRMGHQEAAAEDFRAAGDNWLALYRLGDLSKALAVRGTPLPSAFFPARRDLYDAAIRQMIQAGNPDPRRLFELFERAHESAAEPAALPAVQARLAAGSLLIEYWAGEGQTAALWATRDRAGIAMDGTIPRSGITQLLIVPDGAPPPEQSAVSYLPYASLLVRDEPWRTPLLPWRTFRTTVATKRDLYNTEAPILIINSPAVIDATDPDRSHIVFSPNESLYRGEIQSLPLARTDLAILSAPDPTQILSRAFLAAGARSTLTTLRPVPGGVQAFFLKLLAHGESKSAALQETRRAYPQYASDLILTGDGQQPTRPVLSWWWVMAAGFLAAGVVIVIWRR